ncbi:hypothetical protein BZZ01_13065 [Nostocales cyanobacterium HT-58-2]|nr:hypothetical protein BZZ01_13065 [Nostocales cyanobacterium HT-58-2]
MKMLVVGGTFKPPTTKKEQIFLSKYFMCDCLPSTRKFCQPLEDASNCPSQYNLLLNNRYRILKPIATGGFGKTFLAVDHKSQVEEELCVIKQFFAERHAVHDYQKARELFHQESLLLSLLGKHPQIPQFLDSFEQDKQLYLVQEWIDGQSLEQELAQEGAFHEAEIRQLLQDFLPVLQFVHEHQVIHRDIKPANIIRRRKNGQLVLVDFGVAKCARNKILEKTGTLIGSAEYAAPEQVKGKAIFASDLYSLGVTCLHLLTQMSPFDLYDCSEDVWIWREYLTAPISSSLELILCKLLQRATKQRYTSATEVLADLNHLPKHIVFPSKLSARTSVDDDDFETPYFGFSIKENLLTSTVSSSSNILWRIFTTFAATYVAFFTIACIAAIQSHLTNTAWKVESPRMKVR